MHDSKELKDGILAEFVVWDHLTSNDMVLTKAFSINPLVEVDNLPSYPTSNAHHDLDMRLYNDDAQLVDTWALEVKYAWNPSYPTFFAEILQTGSRTYSEYLVYPPNYMFYVNGSSKLLYCYKGQEFVDAVKANYNKKFPNKYGTAEGIKFDLQDKNFGYLYSYPVKQNFFNVLRTKQKEMKHRLNGSKGVSVQGSKTCSGLPDLD